MVARQAHNLKAVGSIPAPATNFFELERAVFEGDLTQQKKPPFSVKYQQISRKYTGKVSQKLDGNRRGKPANEKETFRRFYSGYSPGSKEADRP